MVLKPRIVQELHAELVDQILELLLQISDDDGDVADPGFLKLPDLAFHHAFPEDLQEALRNVVGQRDKAGAEARRHDDRAVHAERLKIFPALLCDDAFRRVCQSPGGCIGQEGVYASQRHGEAPGQSALGDPGMLQKFSEQKSGTVHGLPPFKNIEIL